MGQISELFVSLGVKGSEKTISAMTNVRAGLGGIASASLETKAAIVGAIYALERLMSTSAQRGTDVEKLSILLGKSTEEIQKWQFAARQGSESNEDFASSLKSIYQKMQDLKWGRGQPSGINLLAGEVGFDEKKAYDDPLYVLRKAQEFVKNSKLAVSDQNDILRSFGLSDDAIIAARKQVFNQENFNRAPIFSSGEVKRLNDVSVMWDNFENKVQMLFGHFTAAHGKEFIKGLSDVATQAFRIAEAFERIGSNLGAFKLIGDAFKGWDTILSSIANILEGKDKKGDFEKARRLKLDEINNDPILREQYKRINEINQKYEDEAKYIKEFSNVDKNSVNILGNFFNNIKENAHSLLYSTAKSFSDLVQGNDNNYGFTDYSHGVMKFFENNVSPLLRTNPNNTGANNTNINQNLYFQHEGKDAVQIGNSVQQAFSDAYKQAFGQSQVT